MNALPETVMPKSDGGSRDEAMTGGRTSGCTDHRLFTSRRFVMMGPCIVHNKSLLALDTTSHHNSPLNTQTISNLFFFAPAGRSIDRGAHVGVWNSCFMLVLFV
jgi:hypothetical protein